MPFNFDEIAKDFKLVLLDVNINELDDNDDIKDYLQCIRPCIHTFTDVAACLEHLASNWIYHTFLVVSDRSVFTILSQIKNMNHIMSLFIFCENIIPDNLEGISSRILRGAFNSKHDLMVKLIKNIPTKRTAFLHERNVFLYANDDKENSLDDPYNGNVPLFLTAVIDASGSHEHIRSTLTSKDEMLTECRLYYKNDEKTLQQIEEFERTYNSTKALDWYRADKFLYRMVNKALRTRDSHIIKKFRFFIKDLEETFDLIFAKQISDQWSSPCRVSKKLVTLYRGQRVSQVDMEKLQKCDGKHIMINQYISTTKDDQLAKTFAGAGEDRPDFESVIYKIDISAIYDKYKDKPDPCIYYYDFSDSSGQEEEVILRIGTIFRVVKITQMPDSTWSVQLLVEKVDDYRTTNKANQMPMDIVCSFLKKAAQWRNINITDIIEDRLPSNILLVISVFIRLGHLVKHHQREQLRYYQAALSNIPQNETTLIEVGYWAIRMRCFLHVNDWTSIPLNIYRQTVLHIGGELRKKLHLELARIDEARNAFCSAKEHYNKVLENTEDLAEIQLISNDIKQLSHTAKKLEPMLPSGQFNFWHLYIAVLTVAERSIIDLRCQVLHHAIDSNPSIASMFYPDLLFPTVLPFHHLFILSSTDEPLKLMKEKNLTVGQLKERIRDSFSMSYPVEYDFRLIHRGKSLIDEQSLIDYQINHGDIIHLIHGPRIQNRSLKSGEQLIEGRVDRNTRSLQIMTRKLVLDFIRRADSGNRQHMLVQKLLTTLSSFESPTTETVYNKLDEWMRDILSMRQHNDDDDADPIGLLNMDTSLTDDCIRNSGPQTTLDEIPILLSLYDQKNIVDQGNNQHDQPLDLERSIVKFIQARSDEMWPIDRLEQEQHDYAMDLSQLLSTSDCKIS